MGLEARFSQALKDSFVAALQTFYVKPTYRCMFIDDEPSAKEEELSYPCIEIQVQPAIPNGYRSIFNDVSCDITFTTTVADDPKKKTLCEMYSRCREKLDSFDYGLFAVFIEDGSTDDSDNRQEITLQINCNSQTCSTT